MVVLKYFPFGLSISLGKKGKINRRRLSVYGLSIWISEAWLIFLGINEVMCKGWWISIPCCFKHYVNQAIYFPRSYRLVTIQGLCNEFMTQYSFWWKLCFFCSSVRKHSEMTWEGTQNSNVFPILTVLYLLLPIFICSSVFISFSSVFFIEAFHPVRVFFLQVYSPGLILLHWSCYLIDYQFYRLCLQ